MKMMERKAYTAFGETGRRCRHDILQVTYTFAPFRQLKILLFKIQDGGRPPFWKSRNSKVEQQFDIFAPNLTRLCKTLFWYIRHSEIQNACCNVDIKLSTDYVNVFVHWKSIGVDVPDVVVNAKTALQLLCNCFNANTFTLCLSNSLHWHCTIQTQVVINFVVIHCTDIDIDTTTSPTVDSIRAVMTACTVL